MSERTVLEVVRGEDRTLALRTEKKDGDSFSLVGVTEMIAFFANETGPNLQKKLSNSAIVVTDASSGRFTVALTKVETAALKKKDRQDFYVELDFGVTPVRIAKFRQKLNVSDPVAG